MAIEMTGLVIIPAIVMGLIIGLINMIMMIKDETGAASSVIGHGASAFIAVIILTFFSMNLNLIPQMIPSLQGTFIANEIMMRILIALIAAIYVHAHSGLFKGARGAGMHETWLHSLGLGLLVGAAPYIWMFVGPLLPVWMQGGTVA